MKNKKEEDRKNVCRLSQGGNLLCNFFHNEKNYFIYLVSATLDYFKTNYEQEHLLGISPVEWKKSEGWNKETREMTPVELIRAIEAFEVRKEFFAKEKLERDALLSKGVVLEVSLSENPQFAELKRRFA